MKRIGIINSKRGVTFSLLIRILAILHKNMEEELSVSELVLKYKISKEAFYRTLRFLEEYELIEKRSISLNRRGKGKIVIYMLNDKGKLYYEQCIKPYFGKTNLSS